MIRPKLWSLIPTYKDEVYVVVEVVKAHATDAEKYNPETQSIAVNKGDTPDAAEAITNKSDLPGETTYRFKEPVNNETIGDQTVTVVVTYPDGTADEVAVTLHVNSDADNNTPTTAPVTVDRGGTPDPADAIANKDDLPGGTSFAFKKPVNTDQPVLRPPLSWSLIPTDRQTKWRQPFMSRLIPKHLSPRVSPSVLIK